MKKIIIGLILLVPSIASADLNSDLNSCSRIDGTLKRVDCYDNAVKKAGIYQDKKEVSVTKGKGKWDVEVKTNPIDDSRTVVSVLQADSGKGKYGDPITMIIRCDSNKTNMYIAWAGYLGSDSIVVTSRIGSNKSQKAYWDLSTDNKATFRRQPIKLIKSMLGETKFIAQTTPYNESPTTAIFDITGIDNAVAPVRETCSW